MSIEVEGFLGAKHRTTIQHNKAHISWHKVCGSHIRDVVGTVAGTYLQRIVGRFELPWLLIGWQLKTLVHWVWTTISTSKEPSFIRKI